MYKCKDCNYYYKSRSGLYKHNKLIHNIINCEKCNIYYKNITQLYEHNLLIHKNINYICNICNINYKTSSGLYKHNKSKHNNCTYICEICNKTFKTFDGYNKHLLVHNKIIINDNINDTNDDINTHIDENDIIEVYDNTVNNINMQNSNNNNNNINSNNTTNNTNIHNNFYIYPHGKENISLIDDDDIYHFLNNFNCITDYTKLVHCNKKYPQHHSICKTNKKDNYISVYDKSSKTLKHEEHIDDILQHQLRNGYNNIKLFLKKCKNIISRENKGKIEDNLELMKKYMALAPSDRFRKMITFELGIVLYNNRELINKTWQGNISKDYLDYIEEKKYINKNIDNLFIDPNNNKASSTKDSSDSSTKDSSTKDSSTKDSSTKNSSTEDSSTKDSSAKNNKSNNKKILFHSSYTGNTIDSSDSSSSSKKVDVEIDEISKAYEFLKNKKFDKDKINMLMRMLTP